MDRPAEKKETIARSPAPVLDRMHPANSARPPSSRPAPIGSNPYSGTTRPGIGAAVLAILLMSWFVAGAPPPGEIGQEVATPGSARATRVDQVQDALYRLDFERADRAARAELDARPDSPIGHGLMAMVKWNLLLQAAGNLATDDYATPTPFTKQRTYKPIDRELKAFHQANDELLRVCSERLKVEPRDPTALYFQGMAYENLAGEALAILRESGRGINMGKKAVEVHKQVLKLDPGLVDAKVSIATREFASATLPWSLKWLAFLLGYRGNRKEALAKLEEVAERGTYRRLDAMVVIGLLNAWKGDPTRAVGVFESLAEQFPENYLLDINRAAIWENTIGDRKKALEIYQSLLRDLDQKAPGIRAGEIHLRIGRTYYGMREYSPALEAFQKVLTSPVAEAETVTLSHYYSALIHDQQGDREAAAREFSAVLEYSGPPSALREELATAKKKLSRR